MEQQKHVLFHPPWPSLLFSCLVGAFLAFLVMVFHLAPVDIKVPGLDAIYGMRFCLDGLNGFFILLLFLIASLFLFFEKGLSSSFRFSVFCLVGLLFFLAGNLVFFIFILALLYMVIDDGSRRFAYWGSLVSLLGLAGMAPHVVKDSFGFSDLSFALLFQQKDGFAFLFLFLLLPVWSLLGFFQCGRNQLRDIKGQYCETVRYFGYGVTGLAGMYGLFRFGMDIYKNHVPLFETGVLEFSGLMVALWTGWRGLMTRKPFQQLYYLFVLSNAVMIQMAGILWIYSFLGNFSEVNSAYDFLFFGLFVQNLGFVLAFLLILALEKQLESLTSLISLCLLGFLLSGFPPFAGFSIFWGYMQLGIGIVSNHYFGSLFILCLVGINAIVFLLVLLGWLNFILGIGKPFLGKHRVRIKAYFTLRSERLSKLWIMALFCLSLMPGVISFLIIPIKRFTLDQKIQHVFLFSLGRGELQNGFIPMGGILFFTVILLFVYGININKRHNCPEKEKQELSAFDKDMLASGQFEKTRFGFGSLNFGYMLTDMFFMKRYHSFMVGRYRNWLGIERKIDVFVKSVNEILWNNEHVALLVLFVLGLLSIGLFL